MKAKHFCACHAINFLTFYIPQIFENWLLILHFFLETRKKFDLRKRKDLNCNRICFSLRVDKIRASCMHSNAFFMPYLPIMLIVNTVYRQNMYRATYNAGHYAPFSAYIKKWSTCKNFSFLTKLF